MYKTHIYVIYLQSIYYRVNFAKNKTSAFPFVSTLAWGGS